jgi:Core-2/I-Branching enzyme
LRARIAYVVSAYKYPEQLGRLLRRLSTSNAQFAVHVDRKTRPSVFRAMEREAEGVPNVVFLERHVSHWAGFGHVRATLKGIEHLVGGKRTFDYVVLLTGQDYPLRSPAAIETFLHAAGGRSYITHWPLPYPDWEPRGGLDRIEDWHLITYGRLRIALPLRRSLPGGLRPYGGGAYWCLARPLVEYVHEFVVQHPDYVRFFKHVLVPDELFFQTIVLNSPLSGTIENNHLRFIDWSEDPGPTILRLEHLPRMMESGKLFARKFDTTVDAKVLDALDAYIDADDV